MSIRLVIMGTGSFAAPMFAAIHDTSHQVVALVTRPPRTVHDRHATVNPMRDLAGQHDTEVFDPEDINDQQARDQLKRYRPDLLVVADYGQILSPETLAIAPHGGINLHGSLLPKYRGAAPINWALYDGETQTGVTVIHMTARLDAGPCLAQEPTPIGPDETAVTLEQRLANMGADLICRTIDDIEAGTTRSVPQVAVQATKAPRLRKSDGAVDWSRPAVAIRNQVRALKPWPGTFTFWQRPDKAPLRMILDQLAIASVPADAAPGTIVRAADGRLEIASGDGIVRIDRAQPAGKKLLTAQELLRGYPLQVGQMLGAGAKT